MLLRLREPSAGRIRRERDDGPRSRLLVWLVAVPAALGRFVLPAHVPALAGEVIATTATTAATTATTAATATAATATAATARV